MLLLPLRDTEPEGAQSVYRDALRLFQQGRLAQAHTEAEAGWERYRQSDPVWAGAFQLLYARVLLNEAEDESQYRNVLNLLALNPNPGSTDEKIQRLSLEAATFAFLGEPKAAEQSLTEAETLCGGADFVACGGVLTTRGMLAGLQGQQGQRDQERGFYLQAFNFARSHKDTWRQANTGQHLGYMALHADRPDEAIDWSRATAKTAAQHGYDDLAQKAAGNLGFAYYQLGDNERALEQFEQAEKAAADLEDFGDEQIWLSDASYVYRDRGDLDRAAELGRKALALARKIGNKEEEVNALGDLASRETSSGDLKDAGAHLQEALRMETAGNRKPRPIFVLLQAELAAAQKDYAKAEGMFHTVFSDKDSRVTERLSAGNELGRMYEEMGKDAPAERMYKATIGEWGAARAQLKREESQLSFGTNVSGIFRNYVRFLVERGRTAEALALADQSRARTLAEGLGMAQIHERTPPEALHPEQIARKTDATLLFYWLDTQQSYLWAIGPEKTAFFKLPGEKEIAGRVKSYDNAILNLRDPAQRANADGRVLYEVLVAPAKKMMDAQRPVIVLADGALSELNFETLLTPGGKDTKSHYLIEDATLLSAPSLDLLKHGEEGRRAAETKNLLLMGNPAEADTEFPPLPLFGVEMTRIASHFTSAETAVFAGGQATPAAYSTADPGKYAYIHFVSHATASLASPLDSAIILSNPAASATAGAEISPVSAYKLYAREIVAHTLTARLVTVSACNGSGTRAYAGEGLVGLSWAFLRAGARQVVAALWEASDESNPRLMDGLYKGIEEGKKPAEALREAKLALLHSGTRFEQPFYWAAFQIYSRE